jgi:hypothetical protein
VHLLALVPTPLAASRAARRLCDAQGGVLLGPAVTTFDRLAPSLLAEAGDRHAVLGPLAERLLAVRSFGGPDGSPGRLDPAGGLASAVAGTMAELRGGEVTAELARAAAEALAGAPRERLLAAAGALGRYEEALRDLGALDRWGALREAARAVRRGAAREAARPSLLLLDGFAALSPGEWDLFAALAARAGRTRAHVPYFPERPEPSAPAEPLLRRIEAEHELAARGEVEVVLPRVEGRPARTAALLLAFAGGRVAPAGEGGLVLAAAGAGEEGEAEEAARTAARLLDEGLDPGEVAVVAPSPRVSAGRLAEAFEEAGIPFAAGRGAPLAGVPVVKAVREALGAAAAGLCRRSAERLSCSTYLSGAAGSARLAHLLDRAGAIDGRLAPAEALRRRAAALTAPGASRERAALSRGASDLEALAAALRPLAAPGTAREHAARLSAWMESVGLRRRAARAERSVAARDLAALSRLEDSAEGLAQALALLGRGAERLTAADFAALLDAALAAASLPPPAEPACGAVELWALGEAPGLAARAAILVGCARGAWPPPPPPEPVLRDPEREAVNGALRRAALPTSARRRAEARHAAFCAVAAGAEAVAFTWAAPGAGGTGGSPAPLVVEAMAALGLETPPGPGDPQPLAGARTARAALRAAVRLDREGAGPAAASALGPVGLDGRLASALARGAVERGRREALRAGRSGPFAGAVPADAIAPALPAEWSPTQLESYARCPFRLLLGLGVRLAEPEAAGLDLDGRAQGSLLHAVLERVVRDSVDRGAWPPGGGAGDLARARAVAEEVLRRFEREGRVGDPAVWAARREAALARVERFVAAEARNVDGLVPALLEHRFGGSSGRPPLALEAGGERVLLQGRIDRVDASAGRLVVVDYKSSGDVRRHQAQLDPGALGVTSFQPPVYLLAAARDLPGRARHAATYLLLRRPDRLAPVEIDPRDPRAGAGGGGPGRPLAGAVVEMVGRIRAGRFPVVPSECRGCPFGAVCRSEGAEPPGAEAA